MLSVPEHCTYIYGKIQFIPISAGYKLLQSVGMWWLNWGCGGSMVVHQAVKHAVPGSNPASLQPAGTCHSLLGSQQGIGMTTAGWPLRGGRGKKYKNTKKRKKEKKEKNIF